MPEQSIVLIILGFACGMLGGLFGIGGGVLMVPALVLLAFPQKDAQGMALAAMIPMAIVGAIRYKLNPDVHFEMSAVGVLAVGSVCGVLVGAWLAGILDSVILRRLFAGLLVLIAFKLLLTAPSKQPASSPGETQEPVAETLDT